MRMAITVRYLDSVVYDQVVDAWPGYCVGERSADCAVPGLDLVLGAGPAGWTLSGRPIEVDEPVTFSAGDAEVRVELLSESPTRPTAAPAARLFVSMVAMATFAGSWEVAQAFAAERPELVALAALWSPGADSASSMTSVEPEIRLLAPVRYVSAAPPGGPEPEPEDSGLIVR